MEIERRARILKQYLGFFLVRSDEVLQRKIQGKVQEGDRIFLVKGPEEDFREVVQFFLLRHKTQKNWEYLPFAQLLDIRMGNHQVYSSLADIQHDIVIASFFARDMETRVDDSILFQFLHCRQQLLKKDTIFYTDRSKLGVQSSDFQKVINIYNLTNEEDKF